MRVTNELHAKLMTQVVAGILSNPNIVSAVVDREGEDLELITNVAYGFGNEVKESSDAILSVASSMVDVILEMSSWEVEEETS